MNVNLNKNTLKMVVVATVLIILTILFAAWEVYLRDHFMGTFDQYGLPSKFFRTGLALAIDALPMWLLPSLMLVLVAQLIQYFIQDSTKAKKLKIAEEKAEKTAVIAETKGKNQIEFNRALEIEALKQQVEILKQKYFEEHHKSQDVARTIEEAKLAMQIAQKEAAEAKDALAKAEKKSAATAGTVATPSNAHNEAVISSLKAENKKLQKRINELQEDLEQSNALIEKLLETQAN